MTKPHRLIWEWDLYSKLICSHKHWRRLSLISLLFLTETAGNLGHAQFLRSPEEAMKTAFPKATKIQRENVLLTPQEYSDLVRETHLSFGERVFTFYKALNKESLVGFGGIYSHRIRSKDATILFAILPNGQLHLTEIIAFYEPPEYKPSEKWLDQLKKWVDKSEESTFSDVPLIAGATLTSQSLVRSSRIVLNVWRRTLGKVQQP